MSENFYITCTKSRHQFAAGNNERSYSAVVHSSRRAVNPCYMAHSTQADPLLAESNAVLVWFSSQVSELRSLLP